MEQRTGDRDAGIVDEAEQRLAGERGADLGRGARDRRLVGHVEDERHELGTELGPQALGVRRLAHRAENAKAAREEFLRGGMADAGAGAGDDDGFHMAALPFVPAARCGPGDALGRYGDPRAVCHRGGGAWATTAKAGTGSSGNSSILRSVSPAARQSSAQLFAQASPASRETLPLRG